MGLDKLKSEILEKSRSESQQLVHEAHAEAKRLLDDADERRQLDVVTAKKDAQEVVARERTERLSQARLQAKMLKADAVEELLGKVDDEVWKELGRLPKSKEYPEYFEKLLLEGVKEIGEKALVHVCERDEALAKKVLAKHDVGAKLAPKPLECMGGVLVTSPDGRVRADNTLEARFNELKDERRKLAYRELFKK